MEEEVWLVECKNGEDVVVDGKKKNLITMTGYDDACPPLLWLF